MTWTDFVVRGTLVLAAGFAASFVFGRASAALRHFIWTAAFLALLAMPVAMRVTPKIAIAAWPAAAVRTASASVGGVGAGQTTLHTPAGYAGNGSDRRLAAVRGSEWFLVYLAGLLLVAARFLAGVVRTSRMVRHARRAPHVQATVDTVCRELAIGRPVRTLESAGAAVPMTWGMLRPVVLLPEAARNWPPERLHAVVLHELIHVRRHDLVGTDCRTGSVLFVLVPSPGLDGRTATPQGT